MTKPITITEAPTALLEAARRVTGQGDRVKLDMDGMTVALVPVEDADYMEALEDAKDVRLAMEAMEESRRSGAPRIPHAAVVEQSERMNGMTPEEAEASLAAFEERWRIREEVAA